ncbi:aspartyl-phosphate phosphatase Spo0E family protein [Paenibacillus alginolyticus]|uniref:aspartyl-phosphate phosphatase Spo0E family protein n=1 Tax=Paenibacillus alginolyticus TaxID=59839 RepID=UPI0004126DBC|nr:aspartyl-phosphate phosphatase Spo0E family protein [Paenibacillus alginolyticus]MCY9665731.1 aspartyl-phosphate phosphatase Spo0E family protein [Paenibacillus alginolyticus]
MSHEAEVGGDAKQVLIAVERLREELHDTYNQFGKMSPLILLKSEELDNMLNRYHGLLLQRSVHFTRP